MSSPTTIARGVECPGCGLIDVSIVWRVPVGRRGAFVPVSEPVAPGAVVFSRFKCERCASEFRAVELPAQATT